MNISVEKFNAPPSIEKLRWIMAQLRDPEHGCPWDIKQTFKSIVSHTIEEAYEVVDAIEQGDLTELKKELGDLLFQVVFYSHLGEEQNIFDFDDVLAAICEKLIRRHPHVFGDKLLNSEAEIKANWENEKAKEREQKHSQQKSSAQQLSILADIPNNLPALSQAMKIQKRCAHVGFDWHHINDVIDKVEEEIEEVKAELTPPVSQQYSENALHEELGDLLFAVVNLCRHANADAETMLRQANRKFIKRFHGVEEFVKHSGKAFNEHNLAQLEHYWQQVKKQE